VAAGVVQSGVRIRQVERADLAALHALDVLCFRRGIAYSKAELHYFLRHPDSYSIAAIDDEGGIRGFAIGQTHLERGQRVGHVISIDVTPERRRQGVGLMLMDALMSHWRGQKAIKVRLEVAADDETAQAFYRRQGFAETGRIRGFYMGSLDALVMENGIE
jgi:ribosomal-protein-alanine N-acetyltransferase